MALITKANYISDADATGVRRWQWEGEAEAADLSSISGLSEMRTSQLPLAEGRSLRYRRLTIGYIGTSGIEITPIVMHANLYSGLYLPTQVTQLNRIIPLLSQYDESTLEWEMDFTIPLAGLATNLSALKVYVVGCAPTDSMFVHLAGEVW